MDTLGGRDLKTLIVPALAHKKIRMSGQFGDVIMTYLPPFLQTVAQMVADIPSLHHQMDQAFPIFLTCIEKHWKVWIQSYPDSMPLSPLSRHL